VAAAACFGVAAPLSKQLLRHSGIATLSFLLYAGAFAAVTVGLAARGASSETPLSRRDLPALSLLSGLGGVLGPLLLLIGLQHTTGMAGSLLLNLEAPLTLILAIGLFGEHLQPRLLLAAAVVFAGAAAVTVDPGPSSASLGGTVAIVAACAAWAVDNNVTQRMSSRDPLRLAQVKTGAAAAGLGVIALVTHSRFPDARFAGFALALGAIGYGVSLVLDVHALRLLGAAREAVFFATAPFVGAALAIPLLSERPTTGIAVGVVLMLAGVAAFVAEHHEHAHVHAAVEHEHLHDHDIHHRHRHDQLPGDRHSHTHKHLETDHAHPHTPDSHHRHPH
jgi:drug/metabolite transporter (DMT)-like permease